MKHKSIEWLKRYSGPELWGLVGAYVGVVIYSSVATTESIINSSLFGTWGENLGYYLCILRKDYKSSVLKYPDISLIDRILKITKGIFLEFGLAEILDSFLIRPICLFAGIKYFGQTFGILLGKIAADIVFYLPTIFFYEIRQKFDK